MTILETINLSTAMTTCTELQSPPHLSPPHPPPIGPLAQNQLINHCVHIKSTVDLCIKYCHQIDNKPYHWILAAKMQGLLCSFLVWPPPPLLHIQYMDWSRNRDCRVYIHTNISEQWHIPRNTHVHGHCAIHLTHTLLSIYCPDNWNIEYICCHDNWKLSILVKKNMYDKVITYLNSQDILYEHQYGFRLNYSTIHPIIHLLNHCAEHTNTNIPEYTLSVLYDMSKAFDVINHDIIKKK